MQKAYKTASAHLPDLQFPEPTVYQASSQSVRSQAQSKLGPLKMVRQEHAQRIAAQQPLGYLQIPFVGPHRVLADHEVRLLEMLILFSLYLETFVFGNSRKGAYLKAQESRGTLSKCVYFESASYWGFSLLVPFFMTFLTIAVNSGVCTLGIGRQVDVLCKYWSLNNDHQFSSTHRLSLGVREPVAGHDVAVGLGVPPPAI